MRSLGRMTFALAAFAVLGLTASPSASPQQKPNIVMLMNDDTGGTISALIAEAVCP